MYMLTIYILKISINIPPTFFRQKDKCAQFLLDSATLSIIQPNIGEYMFKLYLLSPGWVKRYSLFMYSLKLLIQLFHQVYEVITSIIFITTYRDYLLNMLSCAPSSTQHTCSYQFGVNFFSTSSSSEAMLGIGFPHICVYFDESVLVFFYSLRKN